MKINEIIEFLGIDEKEFWSTKTYKEFPNKLFCNDEFLKEFIGKGVSIHYGNKVKILNHTFHYVVVQDSKVRIGNDSVFELMKTRNNGKVFFAYNSAFTNKVLNEFYRVLEILGIDVETFQSKHKNEEVPNTIYCNPEFLDKFSYLTEQYKDNTLQIGGVLFHYVIVKYPQVKIKDKIVKLIDIGFGAKVWFAKWETPNKVIIKARQMGSFQHMQNIRDLEQGSLKAMMNGRNTDMYLRPEEHINFKDLERMANDEVQKMFGIPFGGLPIEPYSHTPSDTNQFNLDYNRGKQKEKKFNDFLNGIENGHELIKQSPIFEHCLKMCIIHNKSLPWMIGEIVKENIALKKAVEEFLRK